MPLGRGQKIILPLGKAKNADFINAVYGKAKGPRTPRGPMPVLQHSGQPVNLTPEFRKRQGH